MPANILTDVDNASWSKDFIQNQNNQRNIGNKMPNNTNHASCSILSTPLIYLKLVDVYNKYVAAAIKSGKNTYLRLAK